MALQIFRFQHYTIQNVCYANILYSGFLSRTNKSDTKYRNFRELEISWSIGSSEIIEHQWSAYMVLQVLSPHNRN